MSDQSAHVNTWKQVSTLLSYSDPNGDAATKYQFWDSGTSATSAYFWTPTNSHWAANTTIEVSAADLANTWFKSGSTTGSETLWVRAFDGSDWGAWDTFTVTSTNATPVATISDQSLHVNTWKQVSTLLSYSDADGDAATKYQFWDSGTSTTSAYFWTPTNSHWAANTTIEVSAADLANTWFQSGSAIGSETLWVRAFDGSDWGAWDTFTVTSTNATPVATVNDHSLHQGQWAKIDSWISVVDGDNDTITKYQFWDSGTAATSAYFWTPTNSHWAANTTIEIPAADRANVWIQGGSATGSETLWVRAFDGNEWGAWDTFTLTTTINTAPVATINDQSLHVNQWIKPQSWLSATDAEGDTITQYQFWDGGGAANSGYFWSSTNSHWAAGTAIDVSAADLGNFWLRSGAATGSETMYVRAFDGAAWGSWDSFALTSTNAAPVATINDHTLNAAQWAKLVNWTTTSDADSDAVTKYQIWDGGGAANSAYFWTPTDSHVAAGTAVDIAASDLANVWVQGGTAGGTDTMYIRAFDGTTWGNWDAFTLTTLPNHAPVTTIGNQSLHINEWNEIGDLLSYSDADGHTATAYQFWDGGSGASSGYFWTPANSHWAAGIAIDVSAADLDDVWLRGGAGTGTETMYARSFDGIDWSAWHAFVLTTII
ncbi:hypothetical protein JQ629_24145 [Bradyrhizobium sp. AUGA SZCCT0222]|nr:hypothetical protein [Bradyrhizobium sp. AUGA SZCCT0222]